MCPLVTWSGLKACYTVFYPLIPSNRQEPERACTSKAFLRYREMGLYRTKRTATALLEECNVDIHKLPQPSLVCRQLEHVAS